MNILIAEDGRTAALAIRLILEELGHNVKVATTGIEAWAHIEQNHWPVIITDWMMPGIDGTELCRRIRNRRGYPYSYVILLTSRDSHADKLAGLEAGADDFLAKPFDPEELHVRIKIALRILAVQNELAQRNTELAELATTDPLTGLKNRRYFLDLLHTTLAFAKRSEFPLSLMILDVDRFKAYNDTFGHSAGDEALRQVCVVLTHALREYETVARYGGEEFAVILQRTDASAAHLVGKRIRSAICDHDWPLQCVTVSVGLATSRPDVASASSLIDEADKALYVSKERGRNCVTHHDELADFVAESSGGNLGCQLLENVGR
jgi:diguanylate cyclase (GGDEF)-like protein